MNSKELLERFRAREVRALSRLISLAENRESEVRKVLAQLYKETGKARLVGVTGPPGAGKSSLVGRFIQWARARKETVAVVAVDPVSPLTGGALLGDRIRLAEHFNDPGVFIRSLSTRGRLGGVSQATREAVDLLDAFGFHWVVVETVGVGQNEVDVRGIADLSLVVVVPESGDGVQTLKAGLLEIADCFVVNKADREGADRMAQELKSMLELAGKATDGVFLVSHKEGTGLEPWLKHVADYFEAPGPALQGRRAGRGVRTAQSLLEAVVVEAARQWVARQGQGAQNPYELVETVLAKHPAEKLFGP